MNKSVKFSKEGDNPKLNLWAANEKEVAELKSLYNLLTRANVGCGVNEGHFHYGIIIDLVKDE